MPNITNGGIKNTEIRARKNDIIGVYFLNKKTAETTLGGFTICTLSSGVEWVMI